MADFDVIQSERTLRASDGLRLHVYEWTPRANTDQGRALLAVMHGYGEHAGRYGELAEALARNGHVVHGLDARGHGRSGGQRGHVASFDRYVQDYFDFAQALKQKYPDRPLVMFGHSQGALIALRTLQSRPPLADGLVMSCPLVQLQPAHLPLPVWLAKIIAAVAARLPIPNGIDPNELTHDPLKLEQYDRDHLNHSWTTPSWYVSAHAAMDQAVTNLDAIRLPVLVLSAERDPIVVPDAVKRLYHALPSGDKELLSVKDSFHEVLNEVGRDETYRRIGSWLAGRWKASAVA